MSDCKIQWISKHYYFLKVCPECRVPITEDSKRTLKEAVEQGRGHELYTFRESIPVRHTR